MLLYFYCVKSWISADFTLPDFSLTTLEFPDFSRFSRWVVTLYLRQWAQHIGVTTSTCQGHVTFPVTWPFDSPGAISCRCSIVTESLHCVQKKNTHSHFLSYLHEWCVDLNKNCSEYTQGIVDSEYVYIRYSLWPMTSLWRHFCLAKVEASLQHAISRISFFASTGHLLVRRRGRIVYYLVEFETI